jgi:ribosomal protein S15P/S13E
MKVTLASLQEEKNALQEKLKRNRTDTDTQFDLELVQKNIQTLMEKISKA